MLLDLSFYKSVKAIEYIYSHLRTYGKVNEALKFYCYLEYRYRNLTFREHYL